MQIFTPPLTWPSSLNNLRLSKDQQERLFHQFRGTQDVPTRDEIMLQLFQNTQQKTCQMQLMEDIIRCMSKAYADLVPNFIFFLINLVLLKRDAYLRHAYPNLDAFRLHNLQCSNHLRGKFVTGLLCKGKNNILLDWGKTRI